MSNDQQEVFTFTTASKGGITAIGELAKLYGKSMREQPDALPVVELGVGSYAHANKAYGRIKFPRFEVVNWVDCKPYLALLASEAEAEPGNATANTSAAMLPVTGSEQRSTALATAEANPFLSYGNAVSSRTIVGKLLKFSKGDFVAGMQDEEIAVGTQLVAVMPELLVGWTKWRDNRPADQVMGKISDGYVPPKRKDLGDLDETDWEIGDDGRRRDPWAYTNYLILIEPAKDPVTSKKSPPLPAADKVKATATRF